MSWWKQKKCSACGVKIPNIAETAELRVQTTEGLLILEVCTKCADFFDVSADILRTKTDDNERSDSTISE